MSHQKVQFLTITIDTKNSTPDVLNILKHVRPEWDEEEIKLEEFTEGYVNHMLCCYLKSDTNKSDALVVRAFGKVLINGEEIPMPRDIEVMGFQVASFLGVAQPVYAVFLNGMVYRYAQGRTLIPEDLKNPKVIKRVAKASARFNCADLETINVYNIKGELVTLEKRKHPMFEDDITDKFATSIPKSLEDPDDNERFQNELPSFDELMDLYTRGKERMEVLPKVFAHNDFHIKNMVYNPEIDELSVLDYEMIGLNSEGDDITRLFAMAPAWANFKFADRNYHFTDDDLLPYVRDYMEEKYVILGKDPNTVTQKDMDTLHWHMKMNWAFFSLGMVGFAMMNMKASFSEKITVGCFNPLQMAINFYNEYKIRKDFFWNSSPPQ